MNKITWKREKVRRGVLGVRISFEKRRDGEEKKRNEEEEGW